MKKQLLIFAPILVAAFLFAAGCGGQDHPDDLILTLASGGVGYPTAAVDPNDGTVYWAWFEQVEDGVDVVLRRLDPGEIEPSSPVRVNRESNVSMHSQAPAQVGVGPDGSVYVAWTTRIDVNGRRFPASNLLVSRSSDRGTTFDEPVFVNSDAGQVLAGHTFHNIAVGGDGTLYVTWLDSRERAVQMSDAAGPEDRAERSDGAPLHGTHPMPGSELRIASSTDGGRTFGENRVIARNTCQCCRTDISISSNGTLYVAWRHLFDRSRDIAVVTSGDRGANWSEPERVYADEWDIDACPHSGPALTLDSEGRRHVAWYTGVTGRRGLYRTVSTGSAFDAPQLVQQDVPISLIAHEFDPSTGLVTSWEDAKSGGIRFLAPEIGIDEPEFYAGSSPQVAAGAGTTTLVFAENEAIKARLLRGS